MQVKFQFGRHEGEFSIQMGITENRNDVVKETTGYEEILQGGKIKGKCDYLLMPVNRCLLLDEDSGPIKSMLM